MDYHTFKKQEESKVSEILKTCGVFWAFSKAQFEKNKTPLAEGDTYVRIEGGGFMPKSKVDTWRTMWKEFNAWKNSFLEDPEQRIEHIRYELAKHEAYYTHDIEQTMDALGDNFTREEVAKVFYDQLALQG